MSIERNRKHHQYTRGAEVMRHEMSLYFSALLFSIAMAFVAGAGTFLLSARMFLLPNQREILVTRALAEMYVSAGTPEAPVALLLERGGRARRFEAPARTMLALTAPEWPSIRTTLQWCALVSVLAALLLVLITNWSWRRFGRQMGRDEILRGVEFRSADQVAQELRRTGTASAIELAGVPLERGREVLNVGISGAVGTGKTVAILAALDDIRQAGQRGIVFDPTGEFIQHFYRHGHDIILNPFDARGRHWTPWNEVRKPYDYAGLAESFVPVMNRREPFWEEGAQAVLEDILSRLASTSQATNARLAHVVNVLELEEIHALLQRLPGAVYMHPEANKTALGIRMNVVRASKAMHYVADAPPGQQFSIRRWVEDATSDRWLFLSTREDMLITMRPLLTAWIDIAVRAILALEPTRDRMIWTVVDELASLDRITTLKEAITRGRKHGLACMLGYQNIAQLRDCYGDNDAQTVISMLQTVLALRVPDFATAKMIAETLGRQEIYEKNENFSYGKDDTRDGVTISSRRSMRDLVLPSEVQSLPDMEGYLRLAGRREVMRVAFAPVQYPLLAPPFVERAQVPYAFSQ